jgi:Conjugal transfer protein TraD
MTIVRVGQGHFRNVLLVPAAKPRSFRAGRGDLHRQLGAALAALGRNRAARNRQQAARARHDMRAWQVERRKRTRHLIELGGLVVKARVVDLTGDDRAIILGALLWMADKLKSNQGEQARALWAAMGKGTFAVERTTDAPTIS